MSAELSIQTLIDTSAKTRPGSRGYTSYVTFLQDCSLQNELETYFIYQNKEPLGQSIFEIKKSSNDQGKHGGKRDICLQYNVENLIMLPTPVYISYLA